MVAQSAQANSLIYALVHLWNYVTQHRLFPLAYVLFVIITITPCSVKVYRQLPADQHSTWAIICVATTIVCDVLEMAVLSTTLICEAQSARTIILHWLLPLMTLAKVIGKVAKTEMEFTVLGELAGELMLVVGRFMAVIHSYPSWDLGKGAEVDEYQDNQLTAEEEIVVLGLAWSCASVVHN